MRILFFTHYFPPEVNAPANRTFEHCREWAALGHDVHVITGVPSHPRGIPFRGYRRRWYQAEQIDGVTVHRVWTYLAANQGVARRTLNYLSFVPTAVARAWRLGRFDVSIATSPQFFCAVAGRLASSVTRTPWVFELRDLWPESIAAVGAVRRSWVLRALERLELHLYRHASAVVCLTRSFADNLTRRGIDPAKLAFVPNGIDAAFWSGGDRAAVRRALGAGEDDVIASYIGTVGMAHGLDTVLGAARLTERADPRIRYVVVGDGAELDALRRQAAEQGLTNVTFTGLVDRESARDYMAASDIALVPLKGSPLFSGVLPSKMFEAMAAAKPVVLGVRGEAQALLESAGAGVVVAPEDSIALADAVRRLTADPRLRQALGACGRSLATQSFDRRLLAREYVNLLAREALVDPDPAMASDVRPGGEL